MWGAKELQKDSSNFEASKEQMALLWMFPCAASKATDSATSLAATFDDSSDGAEVTGDVSN